jgi:hypothetical protein
MKSFIKKYNGWISLAVAVIMSTVLFFCGPGLYRLIDPEAGAFDAGYLHAIIYSIIVVFMASGIAWLLFKITAPGLQGSVDNFFENASSVNESIRYGFIIYIVFFLSIVFIISQVV